MAKKRLDDQPEAPKKKPARRAKKPAPDLSASKPAAKPAVKRVRTAKPAAKAEANPAPKIPSAKIRTAAPKFGPLQVEDGALEKFRAEISAADAPLEIAPRPAAASFQAQSSQTKRRPVPAVISLYAVAGALAFLSIVGGIIMNGAWADFQGPSAPPPGGNIPITIWNSEAANPVGSTQASASIDISGKVNAGTSLRVDKTDANPGTLLNNGTSSALYFGGSASGEGIASRRTAGANQWGLDMYTNQLNRLSITNGGNVGIGTAGPDAKLDVYAASGEVMRLTNNDNTTYTSFNATSGNLTIDSENVSDDANETVTIADKLKVSKQLPGALYTMTFENASGNANSDLAFIMQGNPGGTRTRVISQQYRPNINQIKGWYTAFDGNDQKFKMGELTLTTGAIEAPRLVITNAGDMGLGTDTPGAKLDINGQIKISGGSPGLNKVLTSDAAGLASWVMPATGISGSGTANAIPKFTAASTLGNSTITDNGTTVTFTGLLQHSPTATGNILSALTGAGAQSSFLRGKVVDLDAMTTPAAGLGMIGMEVTLPTHSTTSGNISVIGYNLDAISTPITNSTAGSIDYRGYSVGMPSITGGSVLASGYQVATRNVTSGTVNGVYVWPLSGYSVASGTLNGVKIDNVPTPGAGTENAVNIGTGWDSDVVFNDASPIIKLAGTTPTLAITDGTNTLFSVADAGTTGDATVSGKLTASTFKLGTSSTAGYVLTATDAVGNGAWQAMNPGTGPFRASDGSAAAPAYSFSGETDTGFYRITSTTNEVRLSIDNSDKLLVTANGELLLGKNSYTGNPARLVVSENANGGAALLDIENLDTTANATAYDAFGFFLANTGGSRLTAANLIAGKEQTWTATTSTIDSYLAFSTVVDAATNERLRITSGGNVGIGTTGPSYKLDVSGDIRSTGAVYANANGAKYFQGGDDAALYDINVANTVGIYGVQDSTVASIKLGSGGGVISGSGGKIGVGTTSPGTTLDVSGTARATTVQWAGNANTAIAGDPGCGANFVGFSLTGALSGCTNYTMIGDSSTNNTFINRATGGSLYFRENNADQMVIKNSTGNVGIGTTGPGYLLDVNNRMRVRSGGSGTGGIWFSDSTPTDRAFVGLETDTSSPKVGFYNNGAWRLLIDSAGNTGIGTASPGSKLQVETADAAIRIKNSNDTAGGFIGDTYGGIQIGMYNPSAGAVGAVPANTAKTFFIVNQDGDVGSATNNYGSPTFRTYLDDGAGNILMPDLDTARSITVGSEPTSGQSGDSLTLSSGAGNAGGSGGDIFLKSGNGGATGGVLWITAGSSSSAGGTGGDMWITSGAQTNGGNAGFIIMDTGSAPTKREIYIGTSNAKEVQIGNSPSGGSPTVKLKGRVEIAMKKYGSEAVCHINDNGGAWGSVQTAEELTDCDTSPVADYAELYPVVEAAYGDVVVASDLMAKSTLGDLVPKLRMSTAPYQREVIGVVSNNYGDFTSAGYNIDDKDNPMPIALNGRVPTKVSAENGPIKVGDPITTSSKPGVGMKATRPGMIIGYALNSWNGAGVGKINVFINTEYYPGGMFDDNGGVSAEFKSALSLWGASSGWIDCPVSGDCGCPNGYFVTDIRDRGRAIQCHAL
ncbi:hypothetical protein HY633_03635 [Candidatus Uhrbacteria bacterium]|nr:hypothetical protein [Candidatus Uhrbacteria bacterium]